MRESGVLVMKSAEEVERSSLDRRRASCPSTSATRDRRVSVSKEEISAVEEPRRSSC